MTTQVCFISVIAIVPTACGIETALATSVVSDVVKY